MPYHLTLQTRRSNARISFATILDMADESQDLADLDHTLRVALANGHSLDAVNEVKNEVIGAVILQEILGRWLS